MEFGRCWPPTSRPYKACRGPSKDPTTTAETRSETLESLLSVARHGSFERSYRIGASAARYAATPEEGPNVNRQRNRRHRARPDQAPARPSAGPRSQSRIRSQAHLHRSRRLRFRAPRRQLGLRAGAAGPDAALGAAERPERAPALGPLPIPVSQLRLQPRGRDLGFGGAHGLEQAG